MSLPLRRIATAVGARPVVCNPTTTTTRATCLPLLSNYWIGVRQLGSTKKVHPNAKDIRTDVIIRERSRRKEDFSVQELTKRQQLALRSDEEIKMDEDEANENAPPQQSERPPRTELEERVWNVFRHGRWL
jgi:hypothetical protein